jgi:prepilin-type N-terminal cleavage/methylation domain-containing protein
MINKNIKSFTLIEILVVIVVIGILSAFILVGMSSITSSAGVAKSQAWANSLRNAGLVSIVSEYKFESTKASGAVADAAELIDSWGSNNGATTAGPTVTTSGCSLGDCLYFNGTTQFATIADSATLNLGTKMSAFIWASGAGADDRGLFGQYDETDTQRCWLIGTSGAAGSTKIKVNISGDGNTTLFYKSYVTADTVFNNKWHYVGFTYTGNTLKVYVDGVQATIPSPVDTGTMTTLSHPAALNSIGSMVTTANAISKGFTGYLDGAIIFNDAISMVEVQRNYFSGLNNLLAEGKMTIDEYNERVSALNDSLGSK